MPRLVHVLCQARVHARGLPTSTARSTIAQAQQWPPTAADPQKSDPGGADSAKNGDNLDGGGQMELELGG